MSNQKSIATDKSGGAAPRRPVSIRMVQNILLVWLDNNIDDNSIDYHNTITQLRRVVNTIKKYTDGEECMEFLKTMENDKTCIIMSGSLGQHIVPRIHGMLQVDSIFIFCDNEEYHDQWAKEWPKIKGVFSEIESICEALKKAAQRCEQDSMPISIIGTDDDVSKKNLDQLDPSFMYTQIMKEIILTIQFEQQHINEFIQHCRDALIGNEGELKKVTQLERQYRDKTPIWWYTYEYLLYPMLNRTLRLMDVDMIIKMGFFIADLHQHIDQLHQEQFVDNSSSTSFTVYRGQGMSKADFEKMSKTKGGLMSFNNFLSTSKDSVVAHCFAESNQGNPDLIGILFVMTIDPKHSCTPFASITDVSYFHTEDEVLFSMHTVFRIGEIIPMDETNRLFQVKLTLTNDDDKDLRALTDRIREETLSDGEGWYRLGFVLLKMGQSEKAQQLYEILLEQTTKESEMAPIFNQLGQAKRNRKEHKEAIIYHEKALEIYEKSLSRTHSNCATCYNNIGMAYADMNDYSKALSYYETALEIRKQSLPSNHPDLGRSYNNIALVYDKMGDYPKALSYYKKALTIQQGSLPLNHPDLGRSYNNIAMANDKMGDHSKALSYYEKALEIQQGSLPPNHPDLGRTYTNIGLVLNIMGEYPKALLYCKKALKIEQQSLTPNHSGSGGYYINIGLVYFNMGDYLKALSYYEKALEIEQQSLHPNRCHLALSYNNIGWVYEKSGDYSKALSFYEHAADIGQQSLPPNHPDLQMYTMNLDDIKKKL